MKIKCSNCEDYFEIDDIDWLNLKKVSVKELFSKTTRGHVQFYNKLTKLNSTVHQFLINDRDGYFVDHIDKNGLNNKRSNLRLVSQSINQFGRKKNKKASSKYIGVSFNRAKNKWQVTIKLKGKNYFGGLYKTENDAAIGANILYKKLGQKDNVVNVVC